MGALFHSVRESFQFLVQHRGFEKSRVACSARVVAWYAQLALGQTPRVRIESWDATYELPRAPRGPAKVFYVFREDYEPEVQFFSERLRPGQSFIDVGANFGLFTVLASRRVGAAGKVLAFEPWAGSATHLRRNVEANRCANVAIHECALSDDVGTAKFSVHEDCGRNSLGQLDTADSAEVEVRRLDELLPGDARLDWMKIDVEGAEELVLRGAVETLRRCRPAIVFETTAQGPACMGLPPFGAWDFLAELGYGFFDVDDPALPRLSAPRLGNSLGVHPASDVLHLAG